MGGYKLYGRPLSAGLQRQRHLRHCHSGVWVQPGVEREGLLDEGMPGQLHQQWGVRRRGVRVRPGVERRRLRQLHMYQ